MTVPHEQAGCELCGVAAYRGRGTPLRLVGYDNSGWEELWRCDNCNSYWKADQRFMNPLTEAEARHQFLSLFDRDAV